MARAAIKIAGLAVLAAFAWVLTDGPAPQVIRAPDVGYSHSDPGPLDMAPVYSAVQQPIPVVSSSCGVPMVTSSTSGTLVVNSSRTICMVTQQ